MHVYGFHRKPEIATVEGFFRENLRGFGEIRGLKHEDVCFMVLPESEGYDLAVDADAKKCGHRMYVALNNRIIKDIEDSSPELIVHYMWNILAKSLRLWVQYAEKMPLMQLIPPIALCKIGYQDCHEQLCNLYCQNNWTEEHFRRSSDASVVGLCIAQKIVTDYKEGKETNLHGLADKIFHVNRANWETLLNS